MRISAVRHPEYQDDSNDHQRWRLTYKGGRHFLNYYLRRFSTREDDAAYTDRQAMSYPTTFAKAAINKLKNTFYSRMSEIKRIEGPPSYQVATAGKEGGVDLFGSSMSAFMGQEVLAELMVMKRVGIYVDRKPFRGDTKADNKGNKPYLYYYKTEDILSWDFIYVDGEYLYRNVLLRDYVMKYDDKTGMVIGTRERYRQVWLNEEDNRVHIQFWRKNEDEKAEDDIREGDEIVTELERIPFVFGGLAESLIADACFYQSAMMNVASADVNYVHKANFPFYTEEFDPVSQSIHMRQPRLGQPTVGNPSTPDPSNGTQSSGRNSTDEDEISVGSMRGRRFPKGASPPSFIAPPTEPLIASMAKQEQMKNEIFELVDIAASNAMPQHASAESKGMDDRGLESGLSYIGLELEYMEREIGKIWAMYDGGTPPTINYPSKYMLKSDAERIEEAKALNEVKMAAPSPTCAKEISKQIVHVMLVDKVTNEVIDKIYTEIDAAEYVSSDPELIKTASELGMCDAVTGSNALGFDGEKVVPLAQKERAQRLAEIAASQEKENPAARGVPDKSGGGKADANLEKLGKLLKGEVDGGEV